MAYPHEGTAAAAAAAARPSDFEPELVKATRQLLERLGPKALTSVVASDLRASVGKPAFADMLARAGGRTFKLALQKLAPSAFVFGPHSIELAPPPAEGEPASGSKLPRPGTTARRVLDVVVQEIKRFQGDVPGRLVLRTKVEEAATQTLSDSVLKHAASEAGASGPMLASEVAQKVAPHKVVVVGTEVRLVGDPPPASDIRCIVPERDKAGHGHEHAFPDHSTVTTGSAAGSRSQATSAGISLASVLESTLAARSSADSETLAQEHADPDQDYGRIASRLIPRSVLDDIRDGGSRPSPSSACLEVGRAVEAALLGSSSNAMLLAQLGPLIKSTVSPDRYQLVCQSVRSRKMSEVIARIGKEDVTVEPQVGTGAVVVWSSPEALSRMINRLRRESDAAASREDAAAPLTGLSLAPGEFASSPTQLGIGKLAWRPGTNDAEALVLGAAYRGLLERPCRPDGSRCRDVGDLGNRVIQLVGRPAYLRGTQRYKLGALISNQGGPHIKVAMRPGALEAEDAVIDFPSDDQVQPVRDDPVARPDQRLRDGFGTSKAAGPTSTDFTKSTPPPIGHSVVGEAEKLSRATHGHGHPAAAAAGAGAGEPVLEMDSMKMVYDTGAAGIWGAGGGAGATAQWGTAATSSATAAAAAEDQAWNTARIPESRQLPASGAAAATAAAPARPPPTFRAEIPTSLPSRTLTTREVQALQLLATPLSDADLLYSKDLAFHYHMTLTEKENGWVMLGDLLQESPPHATLSEDPIVILLKQGAMVKSTSTGVRVKF